MGKEFMMKTKACSLVVLIVCVVATLGCPSSTRLHETDQGGIWLAITDFDGGIGLWDVSTLLLP